ncbi:hypothetical protein [Pseudomonas sp. MWU13-3659]|uniref:hypothetical protein n=1 Tax=Pseudomonas sp. MWU13-3659 TaxID=2986964 RepID=UPI002074BD87|nr:hypothetical protein [Pseudomonas sp. MWU13-3659]
MSIAITGSGTLSFNREISDARLQKLMNTKSLSDATEMGWWDKIKDWFCGSSKAKAMEHFHSFYHADSLEKAELHFDQLKSKVGSRHIDRLEKKANEKGTEFVIKTSSNLVEPDLTRYFNTVRDLAIYKPEEIDEKTAQNFRGFSDAMLDIANEDKHVKIKWSDQCTLFIDDEQIQPDQSDKALAQLTRNPELSSLLEKYISQTAFEKLENCITNGLVAMPKLDTPGKIVIPPNGRKDEIKILKHEHGLTIDFSRNFSHLRAINLISPSNQNLYDLEKINLQYPSHANFRFALFIDNEANVSVNGLISDVALIRDTFKFV